MKRPAGNYSITLDHFADCRAEQVWMFATHGTRCPSEPEIMEMLRLTDLQDQIVNNHESRNSECDVFLDAETDTIELR